MNNPKHKLVPLEPTEEQWSGFARKVVMWIQMQVQNRLTPKSLLKHLELTGVEPPAWLTEEGEMQTPDHAFSKGTIAAIIYRAMLEDAPASPTQPQSSLHELRRYEIESVSRQGAVCAHASPNGEWINADELTAALAAESNIRFLGGLAPTHFCTDCGALWRLDSGLWILRSVKAGKCCDNERMGEQIEPMSQGDLDEYLKDNETIEECIKRNRRDVSVVMRLLADCKRNAELSANQPPTAELLALPDKWQPIETAPKDGTEILVYEDGSIFKAAWEDECEAWIAFCGQPVVRTPEPTLWSRLSPPTNETLVRLREDG